MTDLPKDLFTYPIWSALHTRHRHFSVSTGDACRYPAEVAPFAAIVSWLHVASSNRNAIDLYLTMGFKIVREITIHRLSRNDQASSALL